MTDELSIGPTPIDGPCIQVGHPEYRKWARIECRAFINQLDRMIGKEFDGIRVVFRVKSSQHDFGTYHEVYAYYDPDDKDQVAQAFYAESHTPEEWDDEARKELESFGYPYEELCRHAND